MRNSVCLSEARGEMTKAPIALQELRRRIYWKAKSEKAHRFWGIFVHVTRKETLEEAYRIAKRNGGAAIVITISGHSRTCRFGSKPGGGSRRRQRRNYSRRAIRFRITAVGPGTWAAS